MVKLTNDIKDTLAATKHIWLATASKDGAPNVVVIGAFKLLDDESLLISDQFFLKTLANLKENTKVAVSWWGDKGGYQIKGVAAVYTEGPVFNDDVEWMKVKAPRFTPKGAVVVKITDAFVLKAGPDAGKKLL
jgi:predicted pyridoxine 5'-phosphate oxidase superfamily flavin-nucleotide-binding protein